MRHDCIPDSSTAGAKQELFAWRRGGVGVAARCWAVRAFYVNLGKVPVTHCRKNTS